jgi:hypothetical protein
MCDVVIMEIVDSFDKRAGKIPSVFLRINLVGQDSVEQVASFHPLKDGEKKRMS